MLCETREKQRPAKTGWRRYFRSRSLKDRQEQNNSSDTVLTITRICLAEVMVYTMCKRYFTDMVV
jgi:hypothetical protein